MVRQVEASEVEQVDEVEKRRDQRFQVGTMVRKYVGKRGTTRVRRRFVFARVVTLDRADPGSVFVAWISRYGLSPRGREIPGSPVMTLEKTQDLDPQPPVVIIKRHKRPLTAKQQKS